MTQKEIWTGYWNAFWKGCLNVLVPIAMIRALSDAIESVFRRKRPTPAEYRALFPQAPPRKLHREDQFESASSQEQIRKILNEMLNESKKHK